MSKPPQVPRIHGWPVSPYTEKVRCYLRYFQIPHTVEVPTAWALQRRIQRAVGRMIMPTVELPSGQWVQDSSDIIDYFESSASGPHATPEHALGRLLSALFEYFGDEWLPILAMHTRWNNEENRAFARDEFAAYGFPWLPRSLGRRLVAPITEKMSSYREILGVTDASIPGVERMAQTVLCALNEHLQHAPFLLGGRPCVGDFALVGPLYAHVYRDPGSRRMFDDVPAVVAWMERARRTSTTPGEFSLAPAKMGALAPIIRMIFEEQWAFAAAVVEAINTFRHAHPDKSLPRGLGWRPCTIGGVDSRRKIATESQWKIQRVLDVYDQEEVRSDHDVQELLTRMGGQQLRDMKVEAPVVRRHGRAVFRD